MTKPTVARTRQGLESVTSYRVGIANSLSLVTAHRLQWAGFRAIVSLAFALFCLTTCCAAFAEGPVYSDPHKTDADFAIQGEYTGTLQVSEGDIEIGVQVIALGKGKFQAVVYLGGLPGDGYNGDETYKSDGTMKNGKAVFLFENATATIANGVLIARDLEGYDMGKLKKVVRKSPTLGKQPPQGAIVLFDGKNVKAFRNGHMTTDGLLMPGTTSKQTFANHKVHIEFRLPYQPEDRGQARGNSGIYMQGRYEVQMLDSFGLEGKDNECGGIYGQREPSVNMCYPPLTWQTYDIDFTAAKYDDQGKLTANPRLTVLHNGCVIHNDVKLSSDKPTRAAPSKAGPTRGPLFLQNHNCPVRYRNIWVVEE